jgi:multidrug resistance efflux pump
MEQGENECFCSEEQLRESYQFYLGQLAGPVMLLYHSVLIFVLAIMISLPFIRINISVKAPGIIRPVSERTVINSLISGKIDHIFCSEGDFVHKGQVLLTMDHKHLLNELNHKKTEEMYGLFELTDLKNLLSGKDTDMVSVKYRMEFTNYHNQYKKVNKQLQKASKEKQRFMNLYMEQFISEQEYDELVHHESLLKSELNFLESNSYNNWQNDLARLQYDLNRIRAEIATIEKDIEYCKLIAPVSGYLAQFTGIYEGSNIQAGTQLASISPDTILIGEIYITPDHIGTIREGQEVMITIDAFDYREWGILSGIITDIPDDFILIDNQPFYKVKCKPDRDYLLLKSGLKGRLKKGMTFQSRCLVARRSIAQLMVSRLDQWLNPNR